MDTSDSKEGPLFFGVPLKTYETTFQRFDRDGAGLSVSQVYCLHLLLTEEAIPFEDIHEVYMLADSNVDNMMTLDEYGYFLKTLAERDQHLHLERTPLMTLFIFIQLLFVPIASLWGYPSRDLKKGAHTRYVLNSFMKLIGLMHDSRSRILNKWVHYLAWVVGFGFFWVNIFVTMGVGLGLLNTPSNVAQLEAFIPASIYVILCMVFTLMITVNDSEADKLQRALKDLGAFEAIQIHVTHLDRSEPEFMDAADMGSEETIQHIQEQENLRKAFERGSSTAEDALALIFYQTPLKKKLEIKLAKYAYIFTWIAGGVFASVPFGLRVKNDMLFWGNCLVYAGSECSQRVANQSIYVSISAFAVNLLLVSYLVYALINSYFAFAEKHSLFERLSALITAEQSQALHLPYLSLRHPNNVVIWSKLFDVVVAFKVIEIQKVERFISGLILMLVAIVLASLLVVPEDEELDTQYMQAIVGFTIAAVLPYLLYPTIFTALRINLIQEDLTAQFVEEKWILAAHCFPNGENSNDFDFSCQPVLLEPQNQERLSLSYQLPPGRDQSEDIQRTRQAYFHLRALTQYMSTRDTSFKLFGVAITINFFLSIGITVAGALGSWAVDKI